MSLYIHCLLAVSNVYSMVASPQDSGNVHYNDHVNVYTYRFLKPFQISRAKEEGFIRDTEEGEDDMLCVADSPQQLVQSLLERCSCPRLSDQICV